MRCYVCDRALSVQLFATLICGDCLAKSDAVNEQGVALSNIVRMGSMCVEVGDDGDFYVYTSHHPNERFRVEHADIDDLHLALGHAIDRTIKLKVKRLAAENARLKKEQEP